MLKKVILAGSLLAAMLPATALASGANQGDESKVLEIDNGNVSCPYPTALEKVEGDMGRWIQGSSTDLIDKVTVKSGQGAAVVQQYTTVSDHYFFIKLTKDVSNYIVWTCPSTETQQEQ